MPEPSERSYYDILGLAPGATAKQVKDAYRRAARRAHPDLGGNAELFHSVAVAYETLNDPVRRQRYDKGTGQETPRRFGADGGAPGAGSPAGPAPAGNNDAYQRPPEYVPPFSPGRPPVVPLLLAGKQSHGSPRQPGLFARLGAGTRSRLDGEARTAGLIEAALLPSFPAARLVNGLEFGKSSGAAAGHALLAGYRMAVIDSFTASPGNFNWDGRTLRHQGRQVPGLRIQGMVGAVQELFPECNVSGWIVIHGAPDNPFDPVIDVPPGFDRSATSMVQVVNAGTAVRSLRAFLASGPQPYVVQLPVLGRLIGAAAG